MKFYCDYRITCLYTSCCDLGTFRSEVYFTNLFILTAFIIISGVSAFLILKDSIFTKKYMEANNINQNVNNISCNLKNSVDMSRIGGDKKFTFSKNGYSADKLSTYNIANVIISVFVKTMIIYLTISKVIEVKIFSNYSEILSDKGEAYILDGDGITFYIFKIAIEFFLILYSFSVLQFGGHILEYHKKYIVVIVIYILMFINYFLVYNNKLYLTHDSYWINTYICAIIVILLITLSIYANTIFFAKLSKDYYNFLDRQDAIAEANLHKKIIENYSLKLSEDNKELYKEATRFLDMYKLLEIIHKIRINRKVIINIGLIFLYTLAFLVFVFNTYMYIRNFKIAYLGYVNHNITF
jgi:hypothetical protein